MGKTFKMEAGKYVCVGYKYKGEVIIPGTTGHTEMWYWIKIEGDKKTTVEEAIMKFAVDAAESLPHADMIEVTKVEFREVKEQELKF